MESHRSTVDRLQSGHTPQDGSTMLMLGWSSVPVILTNRSIVLQPLQPTLHRPSSLHLSLKLVLPQYNPSSLAKRIARMCSQLHFELVKDRVYKANYIGLPNRQKPL